jgi:hypothetical protein
VAKLPSRLAHSFIEFCYVWKRVIRERRRTYIVSGGALPFCDYYALSLSQNASRAGALDPVLTERVRTTKSVGF